MPYPRLRSSPTRAGSCHRLQQISGTASSGHRKAGHEAASAGPDGRSGTPATISTGCREVWSATGTCTTWRPDTDDPRKHTCRRPAPAWPLAAPGPVAVPRYRESSGAVVLLLATVVALAWANSPWKASYETLWHTKLTLGLGGVVRTEDLRHLVNEALMAIFFFSWSAWRSSTSWWLGNCSGGKRRPFRPWPPWGAWWSLQRSTPPSTWAARGPEGRGSRWRPTSRSPWACWP